jgi:hypothetical protein
MELPAPKPQIVPTTNNFISPELPEPEAQIPKVSKKKKINKKINKKRAPNIPGHYKKVKCLGCFKIQFQKDFAVHRLVCAKNNKKCNVCGSLYTGNSANLSKRKHLKNKHQLSPQTREDWVKLFGIPECEVVEEAPAANVDLDDGEQPTPTNTTNEEILEIKKKATMELPAPKPQIVPTSPLAVEPILPAQIIGGIQLIECEVVEEAPAASTSNFESEVEKINVEREDEKVKNTFFCNRCGIKT